MENKIPTKEELLAEMKRIREVEQDRFIDKIADDVEFLNEKANSKLYEPTLHEKQQFERIHAIIANMAKWF